MCIVLVGFAVCKVSFLYWFGCVVGDQTGQ